MYVFGHFCNFIFFHFFLVFFRSRPSGVQWPKSFTGKNTSKHVNNMFENFWERFWAFWKKWSFFHFSEVFPSFDPPGCTGQFSQQKKPQNKIKTSLDTFKNNFGHFWELKIFSIFFRIFPSFDPPGCTRQNFFTERLPRSMFKTCLNLFENIFGHFEKKMKVFPSLDLPGCTGLFFRENYLKTSLDTFGKVFRDFQNLNSFRFLWNFFESPGCFGHSFFPSK